MLTPVTRWTRSIEPYADWLLAEHPAEAKLWHAELSSGTPDQVEARAAEAIAWDWLYHRVDEIHCGLTLVGKSVDFRCRVGTAEFFVEVINVGRHAMTEVTGMPDAELFRGFHGSPAERLHRAILDKEAQGRGLGAPYLVFITTLHQNASQLLTHRGHLESVLHSREFLQGTFDDERGEIVGPLRNVTDLRRAAFTRSKALTATRSHVSGALFGPFGLYPRFVVHGILNPEADHPFDPAWLPDVPFGSFAAWPPTASSPAVEVKWSDRGE